MQQNYSIALDFHENTKCLIVMDNCLEFLKIGLASGVENVFYSFAIGVPE